mgnify:CR=1 FL=1
MKYLMIFSLLLNTFQQNWMHVICTWIPLPNIGKVMAIGTGIQALYGRNKMSIWWKCALWVRGSGLRLGSIRLYSEYVYSFRNYNFFFTDTEVEYMVVMSMKVCYLIVKCTIWMNTFYCIYTYTKGLNTSSYNLQGSHLKFNCYNKYYDKKIR